MPKIIDSHTHINFPAYDDDREVVIKRARSTNIKMICVGTQAATSLAAINLSEQYPQDIWATVGFHPNHLDEDWHHDQNEQKNSLPEKFDIDRLEELGSHPKVVAIGECGLDYFRLGNDGQEKATRIRERQKEAFIKQTQLAIELGKPLMIHCRSSRGTDDAYKDLLSLIRQASISKIAHFYAGGLEITKRLVDAGFYFTFGGVITFVRDYDKIIKYIPLEQILLETDAPYVAPEPHRGKRNEPSYIIEVAKKMAEIKGAEYDKILSITTDTAKKIFKI